MRLVLHFQPRRLLGLFSMVTAMTVVSTSAQAEPPPPRASQCGNGYCDAWADEDAKTCPADCATRHAPPPPAPPPRVLKWHEGQAIPPGYHKATLMRTGLVIIGSVTFGTAWVPAAILGSRSWKIYEFVIPVVGPFILASGLFHSDGGGGLLGGLLVLDGIQQAAGLAIWIAGLAAPKTVLVRSDVKAAKTWWLPTPMSFGKGSAGLGLVGTM